MPEQIAMATAATNVDWPSAIASSVHRTNYKMNRLTTILASVAIRPQ